MIVAFAQAAGLDVISLLEPGVIIGLMIGAMLPYFFTSLTLKSVGTAASHMIDEVRRQFRDDPGIMAGTSKPDYARCVDISTQAALREMVPARADRRMFAGDHRLAAGHGRSGRHAAGRAALRHHARGVHGQCRRRVGQCEEVYRKRKAGGKGSDAHKAAVTGDTVGDPFKDTAGPAMDILIKLMSVISLILAPILMQMTPLLDFLFR